MYASKLGVGKVISKVNNQKFMALLEDVFPDTALSPQALVAERIAGYARALGHASEKSKIEALFYLGDPRVSATEFVVGERAACAGRKLLELPLHRGVLIAAVIRNGRSFLPDGQTVLAPGDRVIVVTVEHKLLDLDDILIPENRRETRL
jgi:trk system potassium uptake protein TrkA